MHRKPLDRELSNERRASYNVLDESGMGAN
jgi:hypothetical protein